MSHHPHLLKGDEGNHTNGIKLAQDLNGLPTYKTLLNTHLTNVSTQEILTFIIITNNIVKFSMTRTFHRSYLFPELVMSFIFLPKKYIYKIVSKRWKCIVSVKQCVLQVFLR